MSSDTRRPVAAVVLSAGGSSRLGVPKQLIRFRGEPLVRRAARAASEAGAGAVIVVLGGGAEETAMALAGLPGITTVTNQRWREGLASSLTTGIREVQNLECSVDGALITTADQPLVGEAALRSLIRAFREGARLVAAEYSATVGVPVIIGREHFDALLALTGDAGAGRWLREKGSAVRRVPLCEAAVDIDTAEDVTRLQELSISS